MKKRKQKNNLGMIIAILIIILSALVLMFAATMYYQGEKPGSDVETTEERQPILIPDITNPPPTQETTAEKTQSQQTESEDTQGEESIEEIITTEEFIAESASENMSEIIIQNQLSLGESDMSEETTITEEQLIVEQTPVNQEVLESEVLESETNVTEADVQEKITAQEYVKDVYQKTLLLEGAHFVNLAAYTTPTAEELIALIETYRLPECAYLDGAPRAEGDFSYAIKRRNLGAIHDPVELQYGILTGNASVRSFPTWQKMSNGTSANDPDILQETMLSAGEGVIVLHQSADQIWSFVQAGYYYGWIETSAIGFCGQKEMIDFIEAEDFAVITVPYVEIGGINLRMGTKLPISETRDSSYVIQIPQKDEQNKLRILEVEVGSQYLSGGYLELSSDAIVEQARKLLGVNYGWGDSNAYMDCTSTLRAVYNCFGLTLPRNSSWMPNTALKVTDLREMGTAEKEQVITSLAPGSILLINGHAMMYIGQENGVESMLHNVTQYLPAQGSEIVKPMKCVITPITICNSAGNNYLELYRYAISVDWDKLLP